MVSNDILYAAMQPDAVKLHNAAAFVNITMSLQGTKVLQLIMAQAYAWQQSTVEKTMEASPFLAGMAAVVPEVVPLGLAVTR